MASSSTTESVQEIKEILKSISRAWSSGDPAELNRYFHDEIKIISTDMKVVGDGKALCIQSYMDFISKAEIKHYEENDPEVYVFDQTAVAFYAYRIAWNIENQSFDEKGQEMYVFSRVKNKWQVVTIQ